MQRTQILFLDIETVGMKEHYSELSERMQGLWEQKAIHLAKKEEETVEFLFEKRAGIFAEFGKIVCISAAYFKGEQLRITSFAGEDEYLLLQDFANLLQKYFNKPNIYLCAHNGKEFDFPYLCRRMLINGIRIPNILNSQGKKPWETHYLDTLDLWKFGDYKHYTSLDLLAAVFQIPSPKNDLDGSQIHDVFWKNHNIEKIKEYCQKDVLTIVQIMLRYLGQNILSEEQVVYI